MKPNRFPVSGKGRVRTLIGKMHDRLFFSLLRRFVPSVLHAPFTAGMGRSVGSPVFVAMPPLPLYERQHALASFPECPSRPTAGHSCSDCCRQHPGFMVLRVGGKPFGGYPFSYN